MSTYWKTSWDAKCVALAAALQTTPAFVESLITPLTGEPSADALSLLVDPRYITDEELRTACKNGVPGRPDNSYEMALHAIRAQRTEPQSQNQAALLALAMTAMSQTHINPRSTPDNGSPKPSKDWSTVHRVKTFELDGDNDLYTFSHGCTEGDLADVFLGKSREHPEELIVLKMAREVGGAEFIDNEASILAHLQSVAKGKAEDMRKRFPRFIETVTLETRNGKRKANILSFDKNDKDPDGRTRAADYVSMQEVLRAYPNGVEIKAFAWMFRRMFEMLGWLEQEGIVHGAVVPSNILIHPGSHGMVFLDWCYASHRRTRTHLVAGDMKYKNFYPPEVRERHPVGSALDIYMAAQCGIALLNGNVKTHELPSTVPAGIARELKVALLPIASRPYEPWTVYDSMSAVFRQLYGRPHYTPFSMPARG